MIEINHNINIAQARLNQLKLRLGNLRPLMHAIEAELVSVVEQRFDDESDGTTAWADLQESTIRQRLKSKRGKASWPGKKLQVRGTLARAISSDSDGDRARIGASTDAPHAITHQLGASRGKYGSTSRGVPIPWGNIPARPFLPITGSGDLANDAHRGILDVIQEWAHQQIHNI